MAAPVTPLPPPALLDAELGLVAARRAQSKHYPPSHACGRHGRIQRSLSRRMHASICPQVPIQRYPPKRGNTPCPKDCNRVGNCDYDYGRCYCPAGWGGEVRGEPRTASPGSMSAHTCNKKIHRDKGCWAFHGTHPAHSCCIPAVAWRLEVAGCCCWSQYAPSAWCG